MPVNARLVIRDADANGAGFLDSFYGAGIGQEAAARAATDAALTVHGAAVLVADRVQPGWWFDGTDTFTADRPFNELQQRQAAFTQLHGYLNTLAIDLAAEGVAHPVAEVHAAHNFPALAHHAAYRVGHHATLTHAQKVAWADAMLLGPSNAANVFQWYQQISMLTPVMGPTVPRAWVDPADASQTTVALALSSNFDAIGEIPVSDTQLADGAWIEELT